MPMDPGVLSAALRPKIIDAFKIVSGGRPSGKDGDAYDQKIALIETMSGLLSDAIADEVINHIKTMAQFAIITPATGTIAGTGVGVGGGVPGPVTTAVTGTATVAIGNQAPASGWIS